MSFPSIIICALFCLFNLHNNIIIYAWTLLKQNGWKYKDNRFIFWEVEHSIMGEIKSNAPT